MVLEGHVSGSGDEREQPTYPLLALPTSSHLVRPSGSTTRSTNGSGLRPPTRLLLGYQLPVPLGDDGDLAVHDLYGGLIVDQIRRHTHTGGPFFRVGQGHIRHSGVIQVRKQRKIHQSQRAIATEWRIPVDQVLPHMGGHHLRSPD